jgi:hypothetical protein
VCTRDRHIVLPNLKIIEPQAASHERLAGFTWCTFFCRAVDQLFTLCVVDDQELHPSQFFM